MQLTALWLLMPTLPQLLLCDADRSRCYRNRPSLVTSTATIIPESALLLQVNFSLPPVYPVTIANFNWAPVGLTLAVLLSLAAWWCPTWGAKHWYQGPRHSYEARQRALEPYRDSS